jgi:hypothetical protein
MSSLTLSYEGVVAPGACLVSWVPSTCFVGWDDPELGTFGGFLVIALWGWTLGRVPCVQTLGLVPCVWTVVLGPCVENSS